MQTVIKTISIKLDEPLHERLMQLAKLKDRSPHGLMKEAITAYIEREEALERFRQETMAGWNEYQTTGEYVSDEAVTAWLESWGTDSEGEPPALCRD